MQLFADIPREKDIDLVETTAAFRFRKVDSLNQIGDFETEKSA